MSDLERLRHLIRAKNAAVRIVTDDEPSAFELAQDVAAGAGLEVLVWSVVAGLRDATLENSAPAPDTEHPAGAMLWAIKNRAQACMVVLLDCAAHLEDARTLRAWRELVAHLRRVGGCLVMIDSREDVPEVARSASARMAPALPTEEEIEEIVRRTLRREKRQSPLDVNLSRKDAAALIRTLRGLSTPQIERVMMDSIADDRTLSADDLLAVMQAKRQLLGVDGLLEFVEAPVSLDEVGGLEHLKAWLAQRSRSFSKQAAEFGLTPPRGLLLLGVQGAGKSLCAKAVATAWQRPLLRLDPGVLYDRYVGESEQRLRRALTQAEVMSPIVLWVDEIEKAFASAAANSTDGGLSQRMFGTWLTWMQEHRSSVFVVATANSVDALPPELLRKGRFDEIFFLDLPSASARKRILEIHLARRRLDPASFDLAVLTAAAEGYSGAEIEQAILSELHAAFSTGRRACTEGLARALKESPPLSITMAEKVEELREWSVGRCVRAE